VDHVITYENHLGESIVLGDGGIYHYTEAGVHARVWDYETSGNRVTGMRLQPLTFDIVIAQGGGTLADRDAIYAVLEADTAADVDGTMTVNGYSLRCRAVTSSADEWWHADYLVEESVTFLAADPYWRRETVYHFLPESADQQETTGLDLPTDLPFDLAGTSPASSFENTAVTPSAFRMTVFGPASSPGVWIGPNLHEVDVEVPSGSRLVIDSTRKAERGRSVYIVDRFGTVTDCFAQRTAGPQGSGSYIFERIPTGHVAVAWPQVFGFDLAVVDERTEPPWT